MNKRLDRGPTHKILIVDDHPIVRHGLRELIDEAVDMTVCAEAGTAEDAIELVRNHRPDAAVIDLSLENGNGLELIKQIRSTGLNTRMLVASVHDERLYAQRALHAGAMGYLSKSEGTENIVHALQQILRGKIFLSPRMAERVLHEAARGGEPLIDSPVQTLSDRELEVFEMIGRGLATRQIAERLHLSPKTIETHREHIKIKLGIENNSQLVRLAVQWILENE